jgi:uncharacterized delta-60 repeat protein
MFSRFDRVIAGLWLLVVAVGAVHAQTVDTAFAPAFREPCTRTIPSSSTTTMYELPDGSVLNIGPIYSIDGIARAALRTRPDGIIDTAWGAESLRGWNAEAAARHGDSAYVLLYRRSADNESRVVRVLANGTVDTTFASEPFGNGISVCLAVDDRQRVVIGGRFRDIRTDSMVAVLRLTPTGAFDPTFTATPAGDRTVTGIVHLDNGSMLVRGAFSTGLGGTNVVKLARIRDDGTVDETFKPEIDTAGEVTAMHALRDGSILVSTVRTQDRNSGRLLVLDAAGRQRADTPTWNVADKMIAGMLPIDSSSFLVYGASHMPFRNDPAVWYATVTLSDSMVTDRMLSAENNGRIGAALRLRNGSIVLAGTFGLLGRVHRTRYARLTPTYALDESYAVPCTILGTLATVAVNDDRSVVVGGYMVAIGATTTGPVVTMDSNGVLLPVQDRFPLSEFDLGSVQMRVQGLDGAGRIYAVAQHKNNLSDHGTLVRLQPDGSVDSQYVVPSGLDVAVEFVLPLADGRAYVAGYFTRVGDVQQKYLARLLADGSLDTTFRLGSGIGTNVNNPLPGGAISPVRSMALGPDSTLFIGGRIESYNGTDVRYIVQLLTDGSLDTTFTPSLRLVGSMQTDINNVVPMPDGSVVLAGTFSQANDVVTSNVIRLSSTGALDRDYAPDVSAVQMMNDVLADDAGNLYVAGTGIIRVAPDGTVDADPLVTTDRFVTDMAIQGRSIVFVGDFARAGTHATKYIARVSLPLTTEVPWQRVEALPLILGPNPVDDVLWVSIPDTNRGDMLHVVDIAGCTVWSGVADASSEAIPFGALPRGTYAVSIGARTQLVIRK